MFTNIFLFVVNNNVFSTIICWQMPHTTLPTESPTNIQSNINRHIVQIHTACHFPVSRALTVLLLSICAPQWRLFREVTKSVVYLHLSWDPNGPNGFHTNSNSFISYEYECSPHEMRSELNVRHWSASQAYAYCCSAEQIQFACGARQGRLKLKLYAETLLKSATPSYCKSGSAGNIL